MQNNKLIKEVMEMALILYEEQFGEDAVQKLKALSANDSAAFDQQITEFAKNNMEELIEAVFLNSNSSNLFSKQ